eukprot:COSAG04_NODE_27755_length_280_cov_0.574586_1_plen_53_part_10
MDKVVGRTAAQVQVYSWSRRWPGPIWSPLGVHWPPFWHGLAPHGSDSCSARLV